MNYTIWTDEPTPIKLKDFTQDVEFRPHVNDTISIAGRSEDYKITRCDPTTNPDNVTVKYFVRPLSEFPEPASANLEIR